MTAQLLLAIGCAGAFGAVARYLLVMAAQALSPELPIGVAIVNVLGCLGFGICLALSEGRWPAWLAGGVLVGFFGAFTTFSSFAAECQLLWTAGRLWTALANVAIQNVGGLLAMGCGIAIGGWLVRA
jgi:CrcB protein